MKLKMHLRKLSLLLPALLIAALLTAGMAPQAAEASAPAGYEHNYGNYHLVKKGESLSVLARYYSVTVHELASANGLAVDSYIYVGQKLYIPATSGGYSGCAFYHHVQKGQTLSWIAKHLGANYHGLAKANNISNPNHILAGTKLCVPQIYGKPGYSGGDHGHHGNGHGYHVVQKGETLSQIAQHYGVNVHHLAKINHISNPNHIYYGQHLTLGW